MTATTGKQAAAAAAKTLLADRITLVETLGAALDTHRRAEQAVTTARTTAATAAQHARDAYDAAKTGGWTAAELNKAGLRAPAATRTTTAPHNTGSAAGRWRQRQRCDRRRITIAPHASYRPRSSSLPRKGVDSSAR